jgi:hypothetical protein
LRSRNHPITKLQNEQTDRRIVSWRVKSLPLL